MWNGTTNMEISWQFLKKLNTELTYNPKILLLVIYPKELKEDSERNLYKHVHSNIIYCSQEVDTTKCPLAHKGNPVWSSVKYCVCVLSHVQLFATQWIVTLQAPLSIGFPRQKYRSGLPFPFPGDLPDPGKNLPFNAVSDTLFPHPDPS